MKSIIIATTVAFLSLSVEAANFNAANNRASETITDALKQSSIQGLLPIYLEIKNALVNNDANLASAKAADFSKALESVDGRTLSAKESDAYVAVKEKLSADTKSIAEAKDLGKQRGSFSTLSLNMWELAKSVKLSGEPLYQQFCPMKKTTWISNEPAIKNPYYGKQMLTCGKVNNTIQ